MSATLLPNLSKIIETLVHKHVLNFLTEKNALHEKQFGFRNNHSTMHALTELTEKIRQICDWTICMWSILRSAENF